MPVKTSPQLVSETTNILVLHWDGSVTQACENYKNKLWQPLFSYSLWNLIKKTHIPGHFWTHRICQCLAISIVNIWKLCFEKQVLLEKNVRWVIYILGLKCSHESIRLDYRLLGSSNAIWVLKIDRIMEKKTWWFFKNAIISSYILAHKKINEVWQLFLLFLDQLVRILQ